MYVVGLTLCIVSLSVLTRMCGSSLNLYSIFLYADITIGEYFHKIPFLNSVGSHFKYTYTWIDATLLMPTVCRHMAHHLASGSYLTCT